MYDRIMGIASPKKIIGKVVLKRKDVFGFADVPDAFLDAAHELFGDRVSLQLISTIKSEPGKGLRGKLGKPAVLERWITTSIAHIADDHDSEFQVTFKWDDEAGVPGAFMIKNFHHTEFYLKTLTLEGIPNYGHLHFVCNSWVYPTKLCKKDRVFFSNKAYLPSETPVALRYYRDQELINLRGYGAEELKEWDRVYDYACYNDLGDPNKGEKYVRPILGGSAKHPYPRRVRTGRPPTNMDPQTESRLPILKGITGIYVPADERLSPLKMCDAVAYLLKTLSQLLASECEELMGVSSLEFDKFQDVFDVYEGKFKLPDNPFVEKIRQAIPSELLKELLRTDGEHFLKFPVPHVIKEDKYAWNMDEEFARQMLAGLNPVTIRRLQVFPPRSALDPNEFGDQTSSITNKHIEGGLGGLKVEEAIERNKLFILDYHDAIMPLLRGINATTSTKAYATRTLLFLKDDGTLKPLAIELSLPHPQGDEKGAISKVFTPEEQGVGGCIWQLAKAYVSVNDTSYHQLISHWLHTHCVMEPFIIASNRQLSVLHPIYKLLSTHFRDTMHVNAVSRQILINAEGLLEKTVFPGKFSMELSSELYKNWAFPEQALPADLIKRGMAVEDSTYPHGLRLLIEDYPFAVDGLEIWSAINTWVQNYCSFYYKNDEMIQEDHELQSWWNEVRTVGHGDKKDEPWWPKMETLEELVHSCTILIWTASALHAAINFGQYPYGGFPLNRPSLSRRFMPEMGTAEFEELKLNPEKAFLGTITSQLHTLIGISLIEILSRHTADEVFLGQRDAPEWTSDEEPLQAFAKFGEKLKEIEKRIAEMNDDGKWKNRFGPVKMPYTLLFPSSEIGLTAKGIPNSISI